MEIAFKFFVSADSSGEKFTFDLGAIGAYAGLNLAYGLIDFSEHTVEQLIASIPANRSPIMKSNESQALVHQAFKSTSSSFLLVIDNADIKGVIARSHTSSSLLGNEPGILGRRP